MKTIPIFIILLITPFWGWAQPDTLVNGVKNSLLDKNVIPTAQNIQITKSIAPNENLSDTTTINSSFYLISIDFTKPSGNRCKSVYLEFTRKTKDQKNRNLHSTKYSLVSQEDEVSIDGNSVTIIPEIKLPAGEYELTVTMEFANKMTGESVSQTFEL